MKIGSRVWSNLAAGLLVMMGMVPSALAHGLSGDAHLTDRLLHPIFGGHHILVNLAVVLAATGTLMIVATAAHQLTRRNSNRSAFWIRLAGSSVAITGAFLGVLVAA